MKFFTFICCLALIIWAFAITYSANAQDSVHYDAAYQIKARQFQIAWDGTDDCARDKVNFKLITGERSRAAIRTFAADVCKVILMSELAHEPEALARNTALVMADKWIDRLTSQ